MPPAIQEGEAPDAYAQRLSAFRAEQELQKKTSEARWQGYREGYETGARNAASQIVLVEVVSVRSSESDGDYLPVVTANVIARMDEKKPTGSIKLRYEGNTSCGPYGPIDLKGGKVGSRYLIFARTGKIDMDSIIAGYAEADLLADRNRAAWKQLVAKSGN